jgi:inositol transport system substrate-binding protein
MKKILFATGLASLLSSAAFAENIGVSMALFDDNFLTVLRNGMIDQAKGMDGVELQVEDAQNDVAKQLDQINNFIASGVDAIIVNPVDTSATQAMSDAAAAANVPLVYVNREPINVDALPDNQAFVASDERESGTLETLEVCRLLKEAGKTEANICRHNGSLAMRCAARQFRRLPCPILSPKWKRCRRSLTRFSRWRSKRCKKHGLKVMLRDWSSLQPA